MKDREEAGLTLRFLSCKSGWEVDPFTDLTVQSKRMSLLLAMGDSESLGLLMRRSVVQWPGEGAGLRCVLGSRGTWEVGKIIPGLCGMNRRPRMDLEVLFTVRV